MANVILLPAWRRVHSVPPLSCQQIQEHWTMPYEQKGKSHLTITEILLDIIILFFTTIISFGVLFTDGPVILVLYKYILDHIALIKQFKINHIGSWVMTVLRVPVYTEVIKHQNILDHKIFQSLKPDTRKLNL